MHLNVWSSCLRLLSRCDYRNVPLCFVLFSSLGQKLTTNRDWGVAQWQSTCLVHRRLWVQSLTLVRRKEGREGEDKQTNRQKDRHWFMIKFTEKGILNTSWAALDQKPKEKEKRLGLNISSTRKLSDWCQSGVFTRNWASLRTGDAATHWVGAALRPLWISSHWRARTFSSRHVALALHAHQSGQRECSLLFS